MKQVPWTEKFRPRSLSEVILTRNQKKTILEWWKTWVILWNLRILWSIRYGKTWLEFYASKTGKNFWRKNKRRWYEFFLKNFEKWSRRTTTREKIFKSEIDTDILPSARPILEKFLESTWNAYINERKIEDKSTPILPLPAYKPLLMVGPPGTGKTSSAYALAYDEGVYVIEFNASDERSSRSVKTIIKEASKSAGFSLNVSFPQKPPRLLLLDEVDGISAQRDKGGFSALLTLLEDIKIPPILTANVVHDPKIRQLMARCITVFFDRPKDYQVKQLVKRITGAIKNFSVPEDIIETLSRYAPDFRSIIVALETYYYTGRLPSLWHERMSSLQDAIRFSFGLKSKDGFDATINMVKRYLQESGEDISNLLLVAWHNAWNFIKKDDLYGFYKIIADADYYYKIGSRRGNWRVAYINPTNLLAYAMAKYGAPDNYWALRKKHVDIPKLGTLFMRLYQILRGETPLGKFVATLARHWHTSKRETLKSLPLIIYLASVNPEGIGRLFATLGCSEETLDAFLDFAKLKFSTKRNIKTSFNRAREHLGLHILKREITERETTATEKKEQIKKEETPIKEKDKKRKKKKKMTKTGTLDLFLKSGEPNAT